MYIGKKSIALILLIMSSCTYAIDSAKHAEIPEPAQILNRNEINFKELHVKQLYFPPHFLWGFAIAEQQNSGERNCPHSNWSEFERTSFPDGTPHIQGNQRSGKACDHWNRYQEDINLMKKDFSANALRFSVAWDRIEPVRGQYSEEALRHYSDEVDALLAAGITPMITLHHFSHPQWFEEMGAFEKEENIQLFVDFSKRVFATLGHKVRLWCTINEPTCYALQGYLRGEFPPGKSSRPLGEKVLRNMLKAHTDTYSALKSMPEGQAAQIGFVHQYLKFEPFCFFNLIEVAPGLMFNNFMNGAVINFLKTGTFSLGNEEYRAPQEKIADFIGLNYYSRVLIELKLMNILTFNFKEAVVPSCYPGEVMTDMPYAIYPQGLYYALQDLAQIGLPIYITETGTADKDNVNDWRRVKVIEEYMKAASLAIEDGIDLRGVFWWTFTDNFEWNMGFTPKFGMYNMNYETQERTLKEGAAKYAEIIRATQAGNFLNHTADYVVSTPVPMGHEKLA